jgi:hypothetical protein
MTKALLIAAIWVSSSYAHAQCEVLSDDCAKTMVKQFIVDPNFFQAELNPKDEASFRAVWLKGNTYRLNVCNADGSACAVMVYDEEGALLYDNQQFEQAQTWDFFAENTMQVSIAIRLHEQCKAKSCVSAITAFKK